MKPTISIPVAAGLWLLSSPASAAVPAPTHAIHEDAPWARAIDDELSKPLLDQMYGKAKADALRASGKRDKGNGVILTGESFDEELLDAHNLPLPAQAYEASPGVLYVAFDGVTISPNCPTSEIANAALNCSPLVNAETTFPAWGSANERAGVIQELQGYYADFDLTIVTQRPPDWLPYTMAVVGGTAGQIGAQGACGIANVQCDGLKRNHVSLNFTNCGNGAIPDTLAQETSHNWGLEHTDNQTDLMFPQVTGGFKQFVDGCMNIVTDPNPLQCGYVHEIHCAAGGGNQQNSYAELLGVFGPRVQDTSAPVVLSTFPENGDVFSTEDTISVTANIDDDSTFIGIKWTWLEGLPPEVDEYTRCTNNVCTDGYNPGVQFEPADMPWDFVVLDGPPIGHYSFRVEAFDADGNGMSEQISFDVVAPEDLPATTGGDSADGSGDGAVDAGADADAGGTADGGGGTAGDGTSVGGDGGEGGGGGCRQGPARLPAGAWLWLLPGLAVFRRRR